MTIELSEYVIDAIADAVVKKMQEPSYNSIKTELEPSYNSVKIELEPCGDAVSRQAAINAAIEAADEWDGGGNRNREEIIAKALEQLPSVTPQPKMGHWIFDEILDKHYYCSECKSMGVDYWDFCPNCGANMQEVKE